jgi:WD40 repeat protein
MTELTERKRGFYRVLAVALLSAMITGENAKAQAQHSRVDLHGDPLPEGAVARIGSIKFRHPQLWDFAFLSQGKAVVTAGADRTLRFWRIANGDLIRVVNLAGSRNQIQDLTLSADGKVLATNEGGAIRIWDVATGEALKETSGEVPQVGCFDCRPAARPS